MNKSLKKQFLKLLTLLTVLYVLFLEDVKCYYGERKQRSVDKHNKKERTGRREYKHYIQMRCKDGVVVGK